MIQLSRNGFVVNFSRSQLPVPFKSVCDLQTQLYISKLSADVVEGASNFLAALVDVLLLDQIARTIIPASTASWKRSVEYQLSRSILSHDIASSRTACAFYCPVSYAIARLIRPRIFSQIECAFS